MGVSLERVQFRFASIIGELCSEPIILSQFAVWVDLKMAEYKAKGAMSLECSGDKPKPSWMKGVIPPENAVLLENSIPRKGIGVENNDDFRQEDWAYGQTTDSNPEEIMLIKEEVRSPSQTESARTFYTDGTNSRKRHSQEHHPHSSKQRRTGSYSQSPITTQNESLLSVIGGAVDENDEARVTELVNRLIPASYSSTPTTSTTVDDMSTGNQQIPELSFTIQESTSNNASQSEHRISPGMDIFSEMIRQKTICRNVEGKSLATVRKTQSDVNIFQRWIKTNRDDDRNIQEISPAELDNILTEFYPSVRKRNGLPYEPESVRLLQASLERHLRQKGYSSSITTSRQFFQSQQILKAMKKNVPPSSGSQILTNQSQSTGSDPLSILVDDTRD